MADAIEKWEYHSQFVHANSAKVMQFLEQSFPQYKGQITKFTPLSLIPELDRLGEQGWELVHMQPVYVGENGDVLVVNYFERSYWTATYFCVFKRRKAM